MNTAHVATTDDDLMEMFNVMADVMCFEADVVVFPGGYRLEVRHGDQRND